MKRAGNLIWKTLTTIILCLPVFSHADTHLALTGSSTVAPLAAEIAKRYEKQHPGVRIDVQMGGSSRGINDARMGLADIGMVSRALKPAEQDLTAFLIAMDGIGIILHQSNGVNQLSDEQIIGIYTGKIRNWQQVGGANLPITVVNKAEGRSTLELFLSHFALKNSQIKAHVVIGDNQQGIKTVSGNPGAIGYVSIGTAEFEEARGTPIKLLPMAGQPATVEAVAKGRYPLSRPLNLVVKNPPVGLIKDFIIFAQSLEVEDLIEAQFFVAP
jgi:phosphate transport system substrate-binding protein